jgi:FkbM family methyltransferase
LGNLADGGYVIYDLEDYDCLISCGVCDDSSFELEFYNKYKTKPGFLFDGTINKLPNNFPSDYYFIKKNISIHNDINHTDLKDIVNSFENIFLKMDIEGWEYPFLGNLSNNELSRFKQIVAEFHGVFDNTHYFPYDLKREIYKLLSKTHMLVHVHGNNGMPSSIVDNKTVPMLLEMTWVRRSDFTNVERNTQSFPINGLDYPNIKGKNEYILDYEPFVFKNE